MPHFRLMDLLNPMLQDLITEVHKQASQPGGSTDVPAGGHAIYKEFARVNPDFRVSHNLYTQV